MVELTPLASAASKGLTAMVRLLMENGANVNYLCSVGVCSYIHVHVHTSILMLVVRYILASMKTLYIPFDRIHCQQLRMQLSMIVRRRFMPCLIALILSSL